MTESREFAPFRAALALASVLFAATLAGAVTGQEIYCPVHMIKVGWGNCAKCVAEARKRKGGSTRRGRRRGTTSAPTRRNPPKKTVPPKRGGSLRTLRAKSAAVIWQRRMISARQATRYREFCAKKIQDLTARRRTLQRAIDRFQKHLDAREDLYLREMEVMRRQVTLDALEESLSVIPISQSIGSLSQAGHITSKNARSLAATLHTLRSTIGTAIAATREGEREKSMKGFRSAAKGFAKAVLQASVKRVAKRELDAYEKIADFACLAADVLHGRAKFSRTDLATAADKVDLLIEAGALLDKRLILVDAANKGVHAARSLLVRYHLGRSADAIADAWRKPIIGQAALHHRMLDYAKLISFYQIELHKLPNPTNK